MLICTVLMVISGILGVAACNTGTAPLVVISLVFLAMFMGASSNYTVFVAVQYWRREDFTSVFACVNSIANIFNAFARVWTIIV